MNSSDNSSDDDLGPSVPTGVLRSRGGWDDKFHLEIEHTKEKMNADNEDKKISAAVDLSQFRNEEVGKGYKAKHVVRQKEAISTATKVVDMSGGSGTFNKQQEGRADDSSKSKKKRSRDEESPVQSYLQSQGMRDFIKETHKILQQR
jgi:hypothetical protein